MENVEQYILIHAVWYCYMRWVIDWEHRYDYADSITILMNSTDWEKIPMPRVLTYDTDKGSYV